MHSVLKCTVRNSIAELRGWMGDTKHKAGTTESWGTSRLGSCEEIVFSDNRRDRHQLLEVLRSSDIPRVHTVSVFAVERSYAGCICSVRFRPNHLVRL